MALASERGIAVIQRPRGRTSPVRTMSAPVTRKAPTAVANPPSGTPAMARKAAPGVDQAMEIGMRVRQE